ncbi:MAG: ABC transporter substrate-binding protein [Desulfobacterales bacterium]|nr:ABC transporter substrate-binding protein [Desulfobacterales bacterium]
MKNKKILFSYIRIILTLFLLKSFPIFAEEGITDTEIRIGLNGPLTGPAALWGEIITGSTLLFDIVNSEGGIYGRKIKYFALDDNYNPSFTKSLVKEVSEKIGIFIWGACVGTEPSIAIKDYLLNRNIPWVSPVSGASLFTSPSQKYIFGLYPLFSIDASILSRFAIKNLDKKLIAVVYQNDRYGKLALEGVIKELSKFNISLICQIPVETSGTKMKNVAQKLQEINTDTVLIFTTPFTALNLLKASKDINFYPQWMSSFTFSDFSFMNKMSNGLFNGMITTSIGDFSETPLLKKYKEALKRLKPLQNEWTVMIHAGVAWTEPIIEALKRCGRNLSREKFIKEMEGLTNFKGIGPEISFKPYDQNDSECRRGIKDLYLVQCLENGKAKKLSEWIRISE